MNQAPRETPIQFRAAELTPELELRQGKTGETLGQTAKHMLTRYCQYLWRERIELKKALTRAELKAICDACNGWWMDDTIGDYSLIWAEVHDCRGLGEKWDIDQTKLVKKIHDMPLGQRLTLADTAQKFWANCDSDDITAAILDSASH